MKTITVPVIGIIACLAVLRLVGDRMSRARLERISSALHQRHPAWKPTTGATDYQPAELWSTLVFHPSRLPDDAEIRAEATGFRWLFIVRIVLLIGLLGGLVALTVWRKQG